MVGRAGIWLWLEVPVELQLHLEDLDEAGKKTRWLPIHTAYLR